MFLIDSLKTSFGKASPFALHVFLIFGVIFYTITGAIIIRYLESPERIKASKKANVESKPQEIEETLNLLGMTGADLAKLDPRVHECVLSSLVDIFSAVGCDDDAALDHTAISTLDDCYRQISVPGGIKIVDDTREERSTTTTEETIVIEEGEEEVEEPSKWNFENALIFSFTVITTIGYGHIVPETTIGRVFVIVYGIIGVPLTLLTIADLGMFIAKGLHLLLRGVSRLCRWIVKRYRGRVRVMSPIEEKMVDGEEKSTERTSEEEDEEKHEPRKLDETIALCVLFALYLFIGAHVLASYEPEMEFFEAFYFNFVTLTTIGLGDFVPKSTDYLFVTLVYIGVGLALTTMAVEIMADGLKRLHYFGRKVKSAANVFVWFGGEKMRLDRLIKNLGDQLNIPEEELLNFQVETFVEQAIKVEDGEIACLRRPVVMRSERPVSYSTIRKSEDSSRLHFVDSTRSSKIAGETVGLPPLGAETERSLRLDALNRLRSRRIDEGSSEDTGRKTNRVRFSHGSFDGSVSTCSMDYSEEEQTTLRV